MTLVHFDEAMIHFMQFSLIIWSGWSSCCHMCRSFLGDRL